MPNSTMNPPIIQQFHALGCAAAPYTQGETKNHMPANKQIVLAVLIAPNLVLSSRCSIPVTFVCSFGVISVAFLYKIYFRDPLDLRRPLPRAPLLTRKRLRTCLKPRHEDLLANPAEALG